MRKFGKDCNNEIDNDDRVISERSESDKSDEYLSAKFTKIIANISNSKPKAAFFCWQNSFSKAAVILYFDMEHHILIKMNVSIFPISNLLSVFFLFQKMIFA